MSERIEIPAEKLHEEMLKLRQGKHMDFLRSLTGMDWGEEGLGVVYHLEDTNTRENIMVSTRTTNREKPELPSVSDIWKGAEFNEREVYDYYGIRFIGHPDMRRLFLRDDWVGYPLRKDYDESLNPLRMTNEEPVDTTQYIEVQHDGSVIEKRETIFDEDEYIINIGPQHPATHGVLRFRVSLEGEIIKKLDVHCGYIHRGIEKMCESLTYPQTLALTDRLDYLGAHQNRHALCMCIEQAMGVEVYSVSTDSHFVHKAWHDASESIRKIKYPMLADPTGVLSRAFGVMIEEEGMAYRGTFLVNPEGKIKIAEIQDNNIGRNADELLRKVEAAQFVATHDGEVCPAKWKKGAATLKPSIDLVGKI